MIATCPARSESTPRPHAGHVWPWAELWGSDFGSGIACNTADRHASPPTRGAVKGHPDGVKRPHMSRAGYDEVVLLTGFPTFPARRMCEELLPADGAAPARALGRAGGESASLASEVDRIHHVAQVSYLGVDAKTAEHVNVGGAREILEFAGACSDLRCLVFHSTAHVSGNREGLVLEDELKAGQSFRNIVEETKGRAEKLVRAAMDW